MQHLLDTSSPSTLCVYFSRNRADFPSPATIAYTIIAMAAMCVRGLWRLCFAQKQHSLVWCVLVAAHSVYTPQQLLGLKFVCLVGLAWRSVHCTAKFVDRQRVQRHSLLTSCAVSSLALCRLLMCLYSGRQARRKKIPLLAEYTLKKARTAGNTSVHCGESPSPSFAYSTLQLLLLLFSWVIDLALAVHLHVLILIGWCFCSPQYTSGVPVWVSCLVWTVLRTPAYIHRRRRRCALVVFTILFGTAFLGHDTLGTSHLKATFFRLENFIWLRQHARYGCFPLWPFSSCCSMTLFHFPAAKFRWTIELLNAFQILRCLGFPIVRWLSVVVVLG